LRLQYKDYAAWQHHLVASGALAAHKTYWLDELAGSRPLAFPLDFPRPAPPVPAGKAIRFELPDASLHALREIGRDTRSSLFLVVLTAWQALLYRYTGQEDFVLATPVAGRDHDRLAPLIGFYVNILLLRARPRGDMAFLESLAHARHGLQTALAHQAYPFDLLVEELRVRREAGQVPQLRYGITWNTEDEKPSVPADFSIRPLHLAANAGKADLWLYGYETTGGVTFEIEYDAALFREATIRGVGERLQTVLRTVGSQPDVRLDELFPPEPPEPAAPAPGLFREFNLNL
jgi:non-ribosomal peptide synthetase component F